MKRILLSVPHMGGAEEGFVAEAFRTNWLSTVGPHLEAFEREFGARLGGVPCVALASGTAAIHLGLRALGVGPGDEVIAPSLTFVASVNPIRYLGAEPVFVDSERATWNMDPARLEQAIVARKKLGKTVRAAVVVHLYGHCADMDPILEICARHGVKVLEDAAEAVGSLYKGRPAGTLAPVGAFSFNGNKIITTTGGGMLCAHDPEIAARVRFWSTQAKDPGLAYAHTDTGYNFRMSNVLAGIGRGQLQVLDDRVRQRRAVALRYRDAFQDLPGVSLMPEAPGSLNTHWLSCFLIDAKRFGKDRDAADQVSRRRGRRSPAGVEAHAPAAALCGDAHVRRRGVRGDLPGRHLPAQLEQPGSGGAGPCDPGLPRGAVSAVPPTLASLGGRALAAGLLLALGLAPASHAVDLPAGAGSAEDPGPDRSGGLWVLPLSRASFGLAATNDRLRPYSTAVMPRQLAGALAFSCERAEGRPCGQGAGLELNLEAQAGFGELVAAFVRVRSDAGTNAWSAGLALDRAGLRFALGPLAVVAGRDVLSVGPGVRTQLALGHGPAPLDHARAQLVFALAAKVKLGLVYALARLRDPQRFAGTLLSVQRAQLELFSRVLLGGTRLLQLGGKGGPGTPLDLWTFLREHVDRQPGPDGYGISNNRMGFDVSVELPELFGARAWYELVLEDTRNELLDAVQWDGDHLLGFEARALPLGAVTGVLVELQRTGRDSQAHYQYRTGMSSAGRLLGSPLGPDAWSLFAQLHGRAGAAALSPWFEWIRLDADQYQGFDPGPGGLVLTHRGPRERRARGGLDGRYRLDARWAVEASVWVEQTWGEAFVPGADFVTGGARAALTLDLR